MAKARDIKRPIKITNKGLIKSMPSLTEDDLQTIYLSTCEGLSIPRVARKIGVSTPTLYNLMLKFPEVKDKIEKCREIYAQNMIDEEMQSISTVRRRNATQDKLASNKMLVNILPYRIARNGQSTIDQTDEDWK